MGKKLVIYSTEQDDMSGTACSCVHVFLPNIPRSTVKFHPLL